MMVNLQDAAVQRALLRSSATSEAMPAGEAGTCSMTSFGRRDGEDYLTAGEALRQRGGRSGHQCVSAGGAAACPRFERARCGFFLSEVGITWELLASGRAVAADPGTGGDRS